MYKYEYNQLPELFISMFQKNNQIHTYCTRTASNLHTPIGNLNMIYRTVRFSGVKIWNSINKNKLFM